MGNRKAATAELLRLIDQLMPGSPNASLYEARLKKLSDKEFDDYMQKLKSGEEILSLIAPNLSEHRLDIGRNLKIAKELGHEFFQQLDLTDPTTGLQYRTPLKYLVIDLPLRRQQQLLIKKIAIPSDNRHVDDLTGQPRGESKGSSLSAPEMLVLSAQGLDRSIEELIKFRGGDTKAFQMMTKQIVATGGVSQDAVKAAGPTRVKSTQTFGVLLKSMHIDNNV